MYGEFSRQSGTSYEKPKNLKFNRMKKHITFLLTCCTLFCTTLFAQNSLEKGLVGYYKFDEGDGETLYNLANGDNIAPDGIIYNPAWSDEAVFGTSLYFDLEQNMPEELPSWVELGNYDPTQGTNIFSFSCWIFWNGVDGEYHGITGKRDDWTHADVHWDVTLKRDGFYQFEALKEGDVKNYLLSPGLPKVGEWENFTLTYDGHHARMYVDGMPICEGDLELGAKTDAVFLLGCAEPEGVTPFQGYIDEVRYYNRKLSDVEVWDIWK